MVQIKRAQRTQGEVLRQNIYHSPEGWDMEYLTFPALEQTGMVSHLFTTRLGGVSQGMYASMNLSFQRGDDAGSVLTNYERVGKVLGCSTLDMVASHQTHTVHIRRVTAEDKGKGVVLSRDYEEIDGLITDVPHLALACFYADCVPLYFVDVRNRAIGLAHSGWRGTVQGMGARMVDAMKAAFDSRPEDIYAAIGPSICRDCYEVSEDVAEAFRNAFDGEDAAIIQELNKGGWYQGSQVITPGAFRGKYQLDLWLANAILLRRAGIGVDRISITDICTCHNPDYLFSHRASQGKRGNLGAFLMLKES